MRHTGVARGSAADAGVADVAGVQVHSQG